MQKLPVEETLLTILRRIEKLPNGSVRRWYNLKGAAEYLGISERDLRRKVAAGEIRYSRRNSGKYRFFIRWLDAYNLGFPADKLTKTQKRQIRELEAV